MPEDYAQINFRINPERKEKWEDYVEESPEYRYVSQLIRLAVKQEIDGDNQSSPSNAVPDGIDDQLDDIQEQLEEVVTRNIRIEEDVGGIRREVTKDPELTELANSVFEVLADSKSAVEGYAEQGVGYNFQPGQIPEGPKPATVGEIATVLNERELRVDEALKKLQQDTYLVASIEENGEEYYYKND